MKKTVLFIALTLSFAGIIKAQVVNIPDPAFKAYLLGEAAINTYSDGEIQVSEAAAFTGAIYVPNPAVTDLTGIEAFTAITGLNCSNNPITSLDLSQNTALTFLGLSGTQISTLDLTANPALYNVNFSDIPTLNSITIANGNNTAIIDFDTRNNPNLGCIQVDDAAYSTTNWAGIDPVSVFSENCQIGIDENQEASDLTTATIFPNPTNGILHLTTASNITLSTITGQLVADAQNILTLDISGVASGVYIATLTDENGKFKSRIKIIKE